MEILREGDKNRAECTDCGSLLLFGLGDIRSRQVPPQGYDDYEAYINYSITCPSCTATVNVTSKITASVGQKIMRIESERRWYDYE